MHEDAIVRRLEGFGAKGARGSSLIKGIGDDAAVVLPRGAKEYWLVTTDLLIEEVDFRKSWAKPDQLDYKSLAVNLSDIAAMGGRPRFYPAALGIPRTTSARWIDAFYRGMTKLGAEHGASLIGGDLSRASTIQISVTVLGQTRGKKVLYRSGARPGDLLYVTGTLGRSAAGLEVLKAGTRPRTGPARGAVQAHQFPEPRCRAGFWLAQSGLPSALMDLSDGLSSDLPRMCAASGVGAEVFAQDLPVFKDCAAWKCDPLELAFDGGEDFELLFAIPPGKASLLEHRYPKTLPAIHRIGKMVTGERIVWMDRPGEPSHSLPARGWDHFRS